MTEENLVSIENLDFAKGNGLIPVIVQDANTKDVLMLAYTNMEALRKTLETGYAHYWSRSRQELWMKGETSGNVQKIVDIKIDCDKDSLLFIVEQKGNACHTGERTCFYNKLKEE
ncbi:MAG: phosphoribosyl-AMP cyclohydrolase [Candidatus Bathycorpusculaceae bacterium]